MANPSRHHTLSRGDTIGLMLMTEAGFVSLIAVSGMFIIIFVGLTFKSSIWINISELRHFLKHKMSRQVLARPSSRLRLIQGPIDLYLLFLFMADMAQAFGSVLNVRWIHVGHVVEGNFCTAQGALKQIGETGAAMTTLVIAIHTFIVIWWRKGANALVSAKIAMTLTWLYVILFVAIGIAKNQKNGYEIPTPYWCWIGGNFTTQRIFGEYLWLWLTLMFSFVAYLPLYFCSRGNVTVHPDTWWKFQVHRVRNRDPSRSIALRLISYPLVYSVLVLPLSIVRWLSFRQELHDGTDHIPPPVTFIVITVFHLSGIFNVLLLRYTRPNVFFLTRDPPVAADIGRLPIQMSMTSWPDARRTKETI